MEFTQKQVQVLQSEGHLLVTGGPGSGKTTISIFKARQCLKENLKNYQRVLFLSFARASVSRVIEAIEIEASLEDDIRKRIDVDTYHSFFWQILKTHGYLIGLPRKLDVLTPQRKAIALAQISESFKRPLSDCDNQAKKELESQELNRLLYEEGMVDFDFFAIGVASILSKSQKIRQLIANKYPIIFFDEFQDTNDGQWDVFKGLGLTSRMIALADPEQRIYDWIGADPMRLHHFRQEFSPEEIDFEQSNHRSQDTEIALYANDMMKRSFTKETYEGIEVTTYPAFKGPAYTKLVTTLLTSIKRVTKNNPNAWSIGVLVPTKKMTREVSAILDMPPANLPKINHEPYVEVEAAMLAAEVIAYCLQPQSNEYDFNSFIYLVINFLRGRGGDKPIVKDLSDANSFDKALNKYKNNKLKGSGLSSSSIIAKTHSTYMKVKNTVFSGNPESDWKAIALLFQSSTCKRLKMLSEDAKNIRLLRRGEKIRQDIGVDWRDNGAYTNALALVREAFLEQHFANKLKLERGVLVMNMHKAKGKQFDETIIFEDMPKLANRKIVANNGRIVWSNDEANVNDQCIQNFRVSITRSMRKTTILTPRNDPCILLNNK